MTPELRLAIIQPQKHIVFMLYSCGSRVLYAQEIECAITRDGSPAREPL